MNERFSHADPIRRQRIAELETLFRDRTAECDRYVLDLRRASNAHATTIQELAAARERIAAQAALLDRVPHDRFSDGTQCRPDCPACAWAKLREAK